MSNQWLLATLPPPRIERYVNACNNTTVDAIDLYRWNSALSLAVFDDIAVVEVAMRSEIARQLRATFGDDWYQDPQSLFDENALSGIKKAWRDGNLESLRRSSVGPDIIHGKLVASLMFGFWVKLLGRGGYANSAAQRDRKIYDSTLWQPCLSGAFPNVGKLDRKKVETAAHRIQWIRNRIAHHENIIWGIPIPGQKAAGGTQLRLSVTQAHQTFTELGSYIDTDLARWIRTYSQVPSILAGCPLPLPERQHLSL